MGIGASIFLLAVGAILAFAVTIDPTPIAGVTVEWSNVGVILMIVGAIGLAWSIMALAAWRDRSGSGASGQAAPVNRVDTIERERTLER